MQTITLKLEDSISDKFMWLLDRFSKNEIEILDSTHYQNDDEYLRSIDGMVESIKQAEQTPTEAYVTRDALEW